MPDVAGSVQASGALADALQDLLRQMIDKVMGGPSKGKSGEPLTDVAYMVLPQGTPTNPGDFSLPWGPAGGDTSDDVEDDGKLGTAALTAATRPAAASPAAAGAAPPVPVPDEKLEHSLVSARKDSAPRRPAVFGCEPDVAGSMQRRAIRHFISVREASPFHSDAVFASPVEVLLGSLYNPVRAGRVMESLRADAAVTIGELGLDPKPLLRA